ncbi:MAG: hypothetical protein PHN38_01335 [Sulfurospirillaceae bacterium]|nr:hypothetical protein [Sulfurospirillaceae bacterium]
MSQKNASNFINTVMDFAIITVISLVIFYTTSLLGAPLWLSIGLVVVWGGVTGYKPKMFRNTLKFLYKDEEQ